MSQRHTYTLRCPRCGESGATELYELVNVGEDPGLRDELLSNRLNRVQCHACRFEFRVDKPLLYLDPARAFLVWLQPPDAAGAEPTRDDLARIHERLSQDAGTHSGRPPPAVHVVQDRVELVERVFLLEAGLDERLMEYVKYLIYSHNRPAVDPARKRLLFNAQDSTAEYLCFVVQDLESRRLENVLHYSREAYRGLGEMFEGERAERLTELFPGPRISARELVLS